MPEVSPYFSILLLLYFNLTFEAAALWPSATQAALFVKSHFSFEEVNCSSPMGMDGKYSELWEPVDA